MGRAFVGVHRIGYVVPVQELSLQQAVGAEVRRADGGPARPVDAEAFARLRALLAERRVELAVGPTRTASHILTVHLERVNDIGVTSVEAWLDPKARLLHRAGVGIRVPRSLAGALVEPLGRLDGVAC